MDKLDESLREIKALNKVNHVLIWIFSLDTVFLIFFPRTISTRVSYFGIAIWVITCIATIIIDKVSDTKINTLKNEYDRLTVKKRDVRDICRLLDGYKVTFLKGPYHEEYGTTAIIAIREHETIKVIYLPEAQVNEIFKLE